MTQFRCAVSREQALDCSNFSLLTPPIGWIALVVLSLVSLSFSQAAPGAARQQSKETSAAASTKQPQQPTANSHVPLVAGSQVEEQILTQPPEVSWDGKQLTIDTENSTLTDILLAVRSATGASVEVPASASSERVALHIGPAPIREVLATLLYGTSFDYIIQASADDADGLHSVIITERGKGDAMLAPDDPAPPGSSVASGVTVPSGPGVRMMRGWASSGKPTFQAAAEAALAEKAEKEGSGITGDSEPANPPESASSTPEALVSTESASAVQGSSNTDASQGTSPDADQPSSPGLTPSTSRVAASITPTDAGAGTGGSSNMGQMVQDLQRMYQQRQQIQADQNRALQSQRSGN